MCHPLHGVAHPYDLCPIGDTARPQSDPESLSGIYHKQTVHNHPSKSTGPDVNSFYTCSPKAVNNSNLFVKMCVCDMLKNAKQ